MITPTIPAGKLANTHGIRGQFKAEIYLDSPASLKKFGRIGIGEKVYQLSSVDASGRFAIIKLQGIDSIEEAQALKGREFIVFRADAPLPEGQYYLQDALGAKALDQEGNEIGTVAEVIENPAHPIFVIRGKEEHLVPAIGEFILSMDLENGILHLNLLEGM